MRSLSEIDTCDINKIIIASGTVIRVSSKKTLEAKKTFRCVQCGCEYVL